MVRRSSILGPDGQPVEVAPLAQALAAATASGARAVFSDTVSSGLTPERLARILRSAALGDARDYLTLAIEMEDRYLHYSSQLQTRRLAFEAITPSVSAAKEVPEPIVTFVHELIEDPAFRDMACALADGVAKGYAVAEIMWDYRAGRLRPAGYEERDQRYFRYDEVAQRDLLLITDEEPLGAPLPQAKFIRHEPRLRGGTALRRGLARSAAWAYLVQSFTLQDWSIFAQIYGIPLRVGRYPRNATDAEKMRLLRAVRDIANDAAAVIPEGMNLEFHAIAGTQGEKVFGALLQYLDRNVSKIVVGQTMTADDGSSLGQAKIHNEVRIDILRADCRQMAGTINRDLIRWAVALNFGPQERYPIVEFPVSAPEDVKALSDGLSKLVPLGLRVGQRHIRDKLGLSEPESDDELLAAPKAAEPPPTSGGPPAQSPEAALPAPATASLSLRHVAGCRCASCIGFLADTPGGAPARDEIDALVDEEMGEWRRIADPMLEEVFARVSAAGSYEEALASIDALRLDTRPLVERLAAATAKARGVGDVVDEPVAGLTSRGA